MKSASGKSGIRERSQTVGLGDGRCVQNYAPALDQTALRRCHHLVERLVDLRISDAHDDDIRAGHLVGKRSARARHTRRALAMKTDDLDF
jgi:hypothetical protein